MAIFAKCIYRKELTLTLMLFAMFSVKLFQLLPVFFYHFMKQLHKKWQMDGFGPPVTWLQLPQTPLDLVPPAARTAPHGGVIQMKIQ